MKFKDYEAEALKNWYGNVVKNIWFPCLGAAEETGEIVGKVKKIYRDKNGVISDDDRDAILNEVGDVLFYLNAICHELGSDLDTAAKFNIEKIIRRRNNGTIHGSGDDR